MSDLHVLCSVRKCVLTACFCAAKNEKRMIFHLFSKQKLAALAEFKKSPICDFSKFARVRA